MDAMVTARLRRLKMPRPDAYRKPAPMLVPDTLTVKMTVKTCIARIIHYESTAYTAR
jgi:hypothetical protein